MTPGRTCQGWAQLGRHSWTHCQASIEIGGLQPAPQLTQTPTRRCGTLPTQLHPLQGHPGGTSGIHCQQKNPQLPRGTATLDMMLGGTHGTPGTPDSQVVLLLSHPGLSRLDTKSHHLSIKKSGVAITAFHPGILNPDPTTSGIHSSHCLVE